MRYDPDHTPPDHTQADEAGPDPAIFEPPYPEPEIGPDRRAKACAFGVAIALGGFTLIGIYCVAVALYGVIARLLT